MSPRGNTGVQGKMTGARAAVGGHAFVPVDASGNAMQGVQLPPEPVLPTRVDSDAHAGGYMPAWRCYR